MKYNYANVSHMIVDSNVFMFMKNNFRYTQHFVLCL